MTVCSTCGQKNPDGFKFCGACGADLQEPVAAREERKVVTVLFADLVGFTSRSESMDPEDVRALLAPYHARLREELERFGGTVEKFIGDAVMALFGAPVAHEDDPERAVRAALAIRDWVREEEAELQLRIAVNTGEALIALGARPEAGEGMASGDVVNTTARLQAAAPVNGIVVGDSTYRATRQAIDYEQREPVVAKGKSAPIPIWEAVQARARFGTGVVEPPTTALVGRDRELGVLRDALARVREERAPQLVTLVGVPGIGKSRLVYELFSEIGQGGELVYWRQGRSLPYGEGVSYWALAEMVKAQTGILETDAVAEAERKLESAIEALMGDATDAGWVLGHLRPLAGLGGEADVSADARRGAFAAWRRFFEAMAEQRPLVLVFEDVHWADDGLLEFIDHVVERAGDVPILVVCTARPELLEQRPDWGGGKLNAATVSLSPLSDEEIARLLAALIERPLLRAELQQQLLAYAGGNPLYAEQYAQILEETQGAQELALPESVQGIIAARVDLLRSEEKELLQNASVLGKVFWLGGVIHDVDRGDLEDRLHALERKGFVQRARRSSVANETEYAFRQLLVRDVAYAQIPRAARVEKHRRAAEWIDSLGRPEDHAEMVAHHFSQALEYARASGQDPTPLSEPARFALREAGDRALGLNAFAAAERFYAAALELWPRDDEARPRLLLSLGRAQPQLERAQPALAEALEGLLALEDFEGAAEAELMLSNLSWYRGNRDEAYDHMVRAERFVEREGTSVIRARVLAELARYHTLGGRDEAAMIVGRQALEMAEALGLDSIRVSMLTYTGSARVRLGDVDGFADMRRAVEIGVEANLPEAARSYTNLAATLMHSGYLDDAIGAFDEGRRFGENFGPSDTLAWLRDQKLGGVALHRGEWDTAVARADELIAGDPHYRQRSAFTVRGLIRLARADPEGALDDAERGVALARAAKDPQAVVPALNALAFIRVGVGMGAEADSLATEVLDLDPVRNEVGAILFFLFWTLRALDRVGELETALAGARPDNRWHAGAQALLRGEFTRAAEIYSEAGSRLLEAYALLQAAEDGQPSAQLGKAIAFFREVRATAWLERAESLVEATA